LITWIAANYNQCPHEIILQQETYTLHASIVPALILLVLGIM